MSTSDDTTKRCPKCERVLPLNPEFWTKDKKEKSGFAGWCKACKRKVSDEWAKNNKERSSEIKRAYVERNPDKVKAARKRYIEDHPDKNYESKRRWYENNIEQARRATNKYSREHPEKNRAKENRHRARKVSASGNHTDTEIMALYISQNGKCFHCSIELNGKFHEDHWIPLSRGGGNDIGNIRIMCDKCNQSKGSKLPHEWHPEIYSKDD